MKELKTLLATMTLLSMASCIDAAPRNPTQRAATSGIPHYQEVINSGIGKPVTRLIDQWGPPVRTLRIGGR